MKATPLFFSLLLFAVISLCSCDFEPNSGIKHFHSGNFRFYQLQFEEASENYEKALHQMPSLAMARHNLACSWLCKEEFGSAINEFDALLTDYPDWGKAYYNRALAYGFSGKPDAAIQDLDAAIVRFRRELAKARREGNRRYEPLRDSLNSSKEERYEASESRFYYGSKIGRVNSTARDTLEFRSVWLAHALAFAHFKRGMFRQKKGAYRGAIEDYDQAEYINCNLLDSLKTGTMLLYRASCKQTLGFQAMGEAKDSLLSTAIRDFDRAINNPEDTLFNWEARFQKIKCELVRSPKERDLIPGLDSLILQSPGDPRPYVIRANCQQMERRFKEAIDSYTLALELDPGLAEALFNRGNCYLAMQDSSNSIANYSECIQILPDYANAWYMRGQVRKGMGDGEGARKDLEQAGIYGHPRAFLLKAALTAEQVQEKSSVGQLPTEP